MKRWLTFAATTRVSGAHSSVCSRHNSEKLHNASLEILERTGVRLFEPQAIELLKKAGAFDWIEHFMAGFEVNDETLALNLIDEVGPDGQYLGTQHTRDHFREHWYPQVFERDTYDDWLARGGQSLAERAAGRVDETLATHKPEPLPEDVTRRLQEIVQRAEARVQ